MRLGLNTRQPPNETVLLPVTNESTNRYRCLNKIVKGNETAGCFYGENVHLNIFWGSCYFIKMPFNADFDCVIDPLIGGD